MYAHRSRGGAPESVDAIVVGAGSAGCVLAARLSEDSSRQVFLLEAGPDYSSRRAMPGEILDAGAVAETHDWGYSSAPVCGGRSVALPRARLVGGCSAINGTFALRGSPVDYDEWAAAGNPGWSFHDLLPVFCDVERDLDHGHEAWHGTRGPVPIRRYKEAELSATASAFLETATRAGHPEAADHNRPGAVGAGPLPVNAVDGLRMSTALTHLADARSRPNLTVCAETLVDRVELHAGRAVGVRLHDGRVVGADTIILAAGAYASPAILLRSGVGPAADLATLGIRPVADLPGVGRHLTDHPLASVDMPVRHTAPSTPQYQTMLTWRRDVADGHDVQVFAAGPFGAGDGAVLALGFSCVRPRSRGSVRLRSPGPADPPRIRPAFLEDQHDLDTMLAGLREARRLARTEPLRGLVRTEIGPAPGIADADTAALASALRRRVTTYHHPVGTCAMGDDPGHGAVVHPGGRVHGIEGLYVADASVMPEIPAANTNLPTIAVAERLSAWLGSQHRSEDALRQRTSDAAN